MISDPLALWAVEFDGSQLIAGIDTLEKMREGFKKAAEANRVFEDSMHDDTLRMMRRAWEDGQKAMAGYREAMLTINYNYQLLFNKTMGWVQAGMQGTTQANQLAVSMQFLSREIANVFTPTINAVIESTRTMVMWFKNLSGEQQATVRNSIMMGLGFLGASSIIKSVTDHVVQLGKAFRVLFMGNPLLAIVSSFAALLMASQEGRKAILDIAQAFKPVAVAVADIVQAFSPLLEVVANVFSTIAEGFGFVTSKMGTFLAYILLAVGAIKLLGIQMAALNAVSWANPFVLILAAAAGLFGMVTYLKSWSTEKPKKDREELSLAGRGFEGVEQTWLRLQESVNKQDYAKTQTDLLGQIEKNTRLSSGGAGASAGRLGAELGQNNPEFWRGFMEMLTLRSSMLFD